MSIPSEQKALILKTERGDFTIGPYAIDEPGPGEVLVRIEATALNPIDWKVKATAYLDIIKEHPAILGTVAAGVVVALGVGVTKFAVGDKQGFFTNRLGTFKQYTLIAAEIAAKIPDNVTFDQAATVPLGIFTSVVGLYAHGWECGGVGLTPPWKPGGRGKYVGQPVVIFGGSSSVGQYTIQLARLSGFSPIITTASPHNNDRVKALGATHTIDRHHPPSEIIAEVKKITSGPIQIVYDATSLESTQKTAYEIVAPGGTLILVLPSLIPKEKTSPDKKIIFTYGTVHAPENRALGISLYQNITRLLASGDIKPDPVEVLPGGLAAIPEGLERMKRDLVSGKKLVVHPQET
ncbi:unnamed protein product [Somion occarium]|uniref:Enoyl reductase (ER) domain-containing protein n=1 Tax=Somion occarium TaxID=3059160 RepID=A0ABP1EAZ9_9APHY